MNDDPQAMKTTRAIKLMVARARAELQGDIAGVRGVIVSEKMFADACAELAQHGWDVSGDTLTINTANGPTLIRKG